MHEIPAVAEDCYLCFKIREKPFESVAAKGFVFVTVNPRVSPAKKIFWPGTHGDLRGQRSWVVAMPFSLGFVPG